MEIITEIKFSDGSAIKLTSLQLAEIKGALFAKTKKVRDIDFFKGCILKSLNENKSQRGFDTIGRIANNYGSHNLPLLNDAIKSLGDEGIIKVEKSIHKYNGQETTKIYLI